MKQSVFILAFLALISTGFSNSNNNQHGVLLYQAACSHCHAPDKAKAMKAPAAFDAKAWQARYQHAKHEVNDTFNFKTIDDYFLYQVTVGKGLMHHGGLCEESKVNYPQLNCNEENYLAAIHYMSHKKNK